MMKYSVNKCNNSYICCESRFRYFVTAHPPFPFGQNNINNGNCKNACVLYYVL